MLFYSFFFPIESSDVDMNTTDENKLEEQKEENKNED